MKSPRLRSTYERAKLRRPSEEKTGWRKVWSILNSGFVLWLLSSVLVGLVVSLWSSRQHAIQKREEHRSRVATLKFEITSRSAALTEEFGGWTTTPAENRQIAALFRGLRNAGVIAAPEVEGVGLPEFRDRSLVSLLNELRTLDEANDGAAKSLIATVQQLTRIANDASRPDIDDHGRNDLAYVASNEVLEILVRLRPFVDQSYLDRAHQTTKRVLELIRERHRVLPDSSLSR